jgi:hypothetical protein
MATQGALTVIVEVEDGRVGALKALLTGIGEDVDKPKCPVDFSKMTTVHFMRWVVLDASEVGGRKIPAQLVLSTNYDLPLNGHLRDLVQVGGAVIQEIYGHCKEYRPGQDLVAYLKRHRVPYAAFYVGARGRSVRQIRRERELRERLQGLLDDPRIEHLRDVRPEELRVQMLREELQEEVRRDPTLRWARRPAPGPGRGYRLVAALVLVTLVAIAGGGLVLAKLAAGQLAGHLWQAPSFLQTAGVFVGLLLAASLAVAQVLLLFLVLFLVLFLALAVVVAVWWQVLLAQELQESQDEIKTNVARVRELVAREDQVVQNQLTHLVEVKPGWFRRTTLRAVLWAIDLLAQRVYVHGTLGPIPTIHFARWVIIDGGRRLLFMSNFDGSWENYLGDFIDKAAPGLTAVWSNTAGCPRARGLIHDGARDEQRFKSWTRDHQIFTQVWYSAYDDLTVDNVNNNSAIRNGLFADLSPEAAKVWLSRL